MRRATRSAKSSALSGGSRRSNAIAPIATLATSQ